MGRASVETVPLGVVKIRSSTRRPKLDDISAGNSKSILIRNMQLRKTDKMLVNTLIFCLQPCQCWPELGAVLLPFRVWMASWEMRWPLDGLGWRNSSLFV